MGTPANPLAMLRSRSYLQLLAVAALLGVPVSAAAYGFLAGVAVMPLVIVAVVVAYVAHARLTPEPAAQAGKAKTRPSTGAPAG